MDVNVKDLNKFIGPDGVTVLDEVRVSPTEPAFRQNGYETNGDKKSFALAFDAGNSEYVEFDDFTFENGTSIKLNIESDFGSAFFPFGNEGLINNFILLTPAQFQIRFGSSASNYQQAGLSIPTSGEYEFSYNNDTVSLFVDGVNIFDLATSGESMVLNTINSRATGSQSTINLNSFQIGSDNYPLKRGLGVELIGSNGTTAEIKTSAANPQQRVNFGMWLKGDDINGWNPYTV